jgi:hypothetical protein
MRASSSTEFANCICIGRKTCTILVSNYPKFKKSLLKDKTMCMYEWCLWGPLQRLLVTGTFFIQKIYALSSSLLQGKYLSFTSSSLRLNIFRLFMILSLTQLYRYTPEIFLFSTDTFKYSYRASLRRIGQEYSANVVWSTFQSLKRIQPLPVRSKLI